MKIFLKYLATIVLVTIAILYGADKLYTYVFTRNITQNPRNKTQYILSLKDKKIDYIFLGSSRVENHINTKLITDLTRKSALNLGTQGGRLDDVYLFLKLLTQQGVSVDTYFIQIDYIYNFESPSTIVGTDALPFINNNVVNSHIKRNNKNYYLIKYIPFYKYAVNDYKLGFRDFFASLINKKVSENFLDGFSPLQDTKVEAGFSLPEKINESNSNFSEINKFCKENKINVVYFTAPFCSNVKNIEYIDSLKLKIPQLHDFSRSLNNDDLYFKDCGHLNSSGANEFTKLLINSLNL